MSDFSTWVLEVAFGKRDQAQLTVGLFNGDREVQIPGYRRVPMRWRVNGSIADGDIAYGPFDAPVVYDRYVIFSGDEPLATVMGTGRAERPPRERFVYTFTYDLSHETNG